MEFDEGWQEVRTQHSTKFLFFVLIGKPRWPPWLIIGWDIFDFSSGTAERCSAKFDREPDLSSKFMFSCRSEKQRGDPDWLIHLTSPLRPRNEFWQFNMSFIPKRRTCTEVHHCGPLGILFLLFLILLPYSDSDFWSYNARLKGNRFHIKVTSDKFWNAIWRQIHEFD